MAPYDDPYTIAGQATIGDEILRQVRAWARQMSCKRHAHSSRVPHPRYHRTPSPSPLAVIGARQVGNPADLDAIFVAIGGGGLIAGVASFVKALQPHVKVIGVEPAGANAMAMSLAKGARITLAKVDGFADGVAVKHVSGALGVGVG